MIVPVRFLKAPGHVDTEPGLLFRLQEQWALFCALAAVDTKDVQSDGGLASEKEHEHRIVLEVPGPQREERRVPAPKIRPQPASEPVGGHTNNNKTEAEGER